MTAELIQKINWHNWIYLPASWGQFTSEDGAGLAKREKLFGNLKVEDGLGNGDDEMITSTIQI